MTILEAHQALARSLGDSFTLSPTATAIPDGVRFSCAQRNNYLYRAMLHILEEVLASVQHLSDQDANKALYKLVPNLIEHKWTLVSFDHVINDRVSLILDFPTIPTGTPPPANFKYGCARILSCSAHSNISLTGIADVSIPIKILTNPGAYENAKLSLRPDPYLFFFDPTSCQLRDEQGEIENFGTLWFQLIYYPVPLQLQIDDGALGMNNLLRMEEKYMEKVLQLASMYAWQDSEDLENVQILSQMIKPITPTMVPQPQMQGYPNANSY